MEVRGHDTSGAGDARRRFEEAKRDVNSSNRDRVQRAREALEGLSEQRSKILRQVREQTVQRQLERSSARAEEVAKEVAEPVRLPGAAAADESSSTQPTKRDAIDLSPVARANAEETDPARQERLDALKREVAQGRLLSQERLERAAQTLLSSTDE